MLIKKLFVLFSLLSLAGCASYQQFKYITEEFEMPSQVFKSSFNQTWQAVIESTKKFDISLKNIETGVIKTRWMDNSNELNFVDSFSKNDQIKAAKFKVIINVVKGFRTGQEVSKVTIYKRQLIEQDFLSGWKEQPSDGTLEKVLLYRINRLVAIDNSLLKIQKEKEKEALKDF